jgi:hypothetical protein
LQPSSIDLIKAFEKACNRGHYSIVQWLSSLTTLTTLTFLKNRSNEFYLNFCVLRNLEMAQWIYEFGFVTNLDTVLEFTSKALQLQIILWLISLDHIVVIES